MTYHHDIGSPCATSSLRVPVCVKCPVDAYYHPRSVFSTANVCFEKRISFSPLTSGGGPVFSHQNNLTSISSYFLLVQIYKNLFFAWVFFKKKNSSCLITLLTLIILIIRFFFFVLPRLLRFSNVRMFLIMFY